MNTSLRWWLPDFRVSWLDVDLLLRSSRTATQRGCAHPTAHLSRRKQEKEQHKCHYEHILYQLSDHRLTDGKWSKSPSEEVLSWPSFALFSLDFPLYSWAHLKIKGGLYIAAPSLAGRSQQTINPVSNPTFEDEVPLQYPAGLIIDEDFSLIVELKTDLECSLTDFLLLLLHLQYFVPPHRRRKGPSPAGSALSPGK